MLGVVLDQAGEWTLERVAAGIHHVAELDQQSLEGDVRGCRRPGLPGALRAEHPQGSISVLRASVGARSLPRAIVPTPTIARVWLRVPLEELAG